MAGAGYKLFNTGDVLLASEVNTYLMQQTVMVFANSTARTSALSGVLAEGMISYLADTNATEVYNGTAWVGITGTGDITEVTAGTGISGGGTTGAVTITNSMATAIDAKGDLIVGTGADTFSRLAVGATDGHVLKVKASESTGLEWGAVSGGTSGLTLISRTTFSSSASHIVDNCFTSTYKSYLVVFESVVAATDTDDFQFQWRTGGSSGSTHTTAYYGVTQATDFNPTTTTTVSSNASQLTLHRATINSMSLWVNKVGNTNERPQIYGTGNDYNYVETIVCSGVTASSITATGFLIKSSSTNITGAVAVYGLALS